MRILVNDIVAEYRDEGNGQVILLLHGWGHNLRTFDALVTALNPSWRFIRLDLPGFGGSELPREPWGVGAYAEFVKAFVEKLGISVDVLVGHSFGGRIALKGVADGILHPRKVILIGSSGLARRKTTRNRLFTLIAKAGKIILFPFPARIKDILRRKLYLQASSEDYLNAGALKNTFLRVVGEDLSHAAQNVHIPTLLIWGEDDTETPLSDGKRLSTLISGSKFEVIKGTGHFVHQERAEDAAQIIKRFVS